jgi:hypothetical protein
MDAVAQFVAVARKHEFEELGDRLGVLFDLGLSSRIEDGEAGVDVPFVGEDAQRDVHLDVLDAADVARDFPGELLVGCPSGAHAQEGGVGDGLRVGCYAVVLLEG